MRPERNGAADVGRHADDDDDTADDNFEERAFDADGADAGRCAAPGISDVAIMSGSKCDEPSEL